MTLAEAVAHLVAGQEGDDEWRAVTEALESLSARRGVVPEFREESVAFAREQVLAMLDDGRLATVKAPEFFFYRVIANRSISLYRAEKRRRQALLRPPPEPPPAEDTLSMARVRAIIDDLSASAVQRRPEQHRAELRASIDRMMRMTMEGLHTRDVMEAVAREEDVSLPTERDRERFVNMLDRRHSRARGYLLEVVTRRRLAPEVEEEAREAVRLLRRRQENRRRASTGQGSP